ncbi:MAG: YwaF family protein [Atopobiaceae bacterium]|jgi:uncharacterized membrane protein YwaF|nr:YwaF family protein [Atopobiaceae bacterium]MCI2173489.1 YwaF family protein [Atopobiaceae bacterium]MCI2207484.1 YwaF family protein [Atopobiaceae bacterium]
MADLLWANESNVASGSGFRMFGPEHVAWLLAIVIGIAVVRRMFLSSGRHRQDIILRAIAVTVVASEAARDVVLAGQGVFGVGYLPLHLCSLSMFVYLFDAFAPAGRLRSALEEVSIVLLLPGSVSALLFPNWCALPLVNFITIHSFLSHAALTCYPLLLLWGGRCRPSVRHFWMPVAFLAVVTPPIAAFDAAFGCDFLFVAWPLADSPLMWIADVMGQWWRLGYALLVAGVIAITYGLVMLWERRHPA